MKSIRFAFGHRTRMGNERPSIATQRDHGRERPGLGETLRRHYTLRLDARKSKSARPACDEV
ncbi:hypothetical protein [Trinickia sp. Y13]|uniref:hypothetical protein n=1 Tax=Trinickia sp. Y13 TaxID=2917807 RepID=UPI0024057876|nr:hypothetical protein [Trinickia sp. Y13]MDG0025807.1 hypothetical protein [Trinickia sp. Y13]